MNGSCQTPGVVMSVFMSNDVMIAEQRELVQGAGPLAIEPIHSVLFSLLHGLQAGFGMLLQQRAAQDINS